MSTPLLVPMDINIDPSTNGLQGINQLRTIVGAVMTIGLILSVLALIVSAIVWGLGANSSNPYDGLSVPGLHADALSWAAEAKKMGQAEFATKGGPLVASSNLTRLG